jgi:protein tyrosine phosphatase (PTP) superfamily phosphohydrolase (DUF442 family)
MRVSRKLPHLCVATAVFLASFVASTAAQSTGPVAAPTIGIGNFGKINNQYYRGEQPKAGDYRALAALGVKMVIDLQRDFDPAEERLVAAAGMKFHRFRLTTSDRPSDEDVTQFLALVDDPANQPVYVHCKGGRHRTGVMTAAYRMTHDGWTADQAYQEMKDYHFKVPLNFLFGHDELKDFVFDYYAELRRSTRASGSLTSKKG